jgi:hypothetical protein
LASIICQGQDSILAEGDWYKIEIAENGIYKIDKVILNSYGINTEETNPSNIQLFVSPNKLLPQKNSDFRNTGFVEIPVFNNNTNTVFDKEDYILFYAENPHEVKLTTLIISKSLFKCQLYFHESWQWTI